MRKNLPVTQRERAVKPGQRLITATKTDDATRQAGRHHEISSDLAATAKSQTDLVSRFTHNAAKE